jgi:hypothetical protein
MSDITAIATMLAIFAPGAIAVSALLRYVYERCDDLLAAQSMAQNVRLKARWSSPPIRSDS